MEEQDLRMRPLLKNSYRKKKRPRSVPSRIRQNEEIQEQHFNSNEDRSEIPVFYPVKDEFEDFRSRKKLPDLSRLEVTSFMNNVNGKTETLTPKNFNSCLYKSLTRSLDLTSARKSTSSEISESRKPPRPVALSGSSTKLKQDSQNGDYTKELFYMMRQSLRMNESVHQEIVKLRQELNSLDTAFNEFQLVMNNRIEQTSASLKEIARTKVGTMICFRCHAYVLEHIQLQCGHIYCLHCINISFIPDVKIQERTAEALREVATKRKCPNCGERKVDVSIIKKKYRV